METQNNKKSIIAEMTISEKGNKVWRVKVLGSRSKKEVGYCKTPLSAIRFAYILKKQTGATIDSDCMDFLVFLNTRDKNKAEDKAAESVEQTEVANA